MRQPVAIWFDHFCGGDSTGGAGGAISVTVSTGSTGGGALTLASGNTGGTTGGHVTITAGSSTMTSSGNLVMRTQDGGTVTLERRHQA